MEKAQAQAYADEYYARRIGMSQAGDAKGNADIAVTAATQQDIQPLHLILYRD
jgi:hypothetical protein